MVMAAMKPETETEAQWIESLKGRRLGPYLSFNPVSATQIWQWCSAMGDNNPAYNPGPGQIAPPAMMQMWTMRDVNDNYAPGSTSHAPYQVFEDMKTRGYPANVAVSYDISFHRYLSPGDQAQHFTTVVAISDKKTTSLGSGFFVTERVEYLTLDEKPFAEALITYFQYQPFEPSTAAGEKSKSIQKGGGKPPDSTIELQRNEHPSFAELKVGAIAVGDALPKLTIPITHKLIVAGAIASQDFIPVHHNAPAAREAGMSDIFMNILTTSGLAARYVSDWAGCDSRLQALKFSLLAPNFPGDCMIFEGAVTSISDVNNGTEIQLDIAGRNALGYHIKGSATVAMPSNKTRGEL